MRSNVLEPGFLAARLDHVPDDVLRDPFAPHLAVPGDGPEDSSLGNPGCLGPVVQRDLHPTWNRDGTDVTGFADQVHDRPVTLPHLQVIEAQPNQLRTANPQPNNMASMA